MHELSYNVVAKNALGRSSAVPKPERYDRRVQAAKGTTSALDMAPPTLQRAKHMPGTTGEIRYLALLRTNGAYRRELAFFRACFEPSKTLVDEVWAAAQQMILSYYHDTDAPQEFHDRSYELALELQRAVGKYEEIIGAAEDDWLASTTQEASAITAPVV